MRTNHSVFYYEILLALDYFGPLQLRDLRDKVMIHTVTAVPLAIIKRDALELVKAKKIRMTKKGNGYLFTKQGAA